MNRNHLIFSITSCLLLLLVVAIKPFIEGGPIINNALADSPIEAALHDTVKIDEIKLAGTHYFDNDNWVVTTIYTGNDNGATAVLHKVFGSYEVVVGPGTSFSGADFKTIPLDVIDYLKSQGVGII